MTTLWSMLFALQEPAQPARSPGSSFFLIQMLLIFAIIYFFMIRPKMKQERKHRERVTQLKKGDEVITAGGIVGEVVHIKDDREPPLDFKFVVFLCVVVVVVPG
ncbi:MAG: preprotein translocase subunit YajC [Gemmatimonadetes bacterium]|nr:preprotein translocase subunit YajC [Gemmatimonadota bacterium]